MNDFQESDKIDTKLDDMNFRNMVSFYYNELLSIKNGVRADEVLSFKERKMLKDRGIISYDKGSTEAWLTKKTLEVFYDLELQARSQTRGEVRTSDKVTSRTR